MKSEPVDLPAGARLLDRYVIMSRVGSGGMASIYRALDERLDRAVCVKLLRTVLEGSDSAGEGGRSLYKATYAHFLQEALALSRLQHPNTLRIYDFGYLPKSGRPFQISEFLEGGNLEEYVKTHGAIAPAEAIAILERITGAVEEAHTHKIIHRDIKPSNILFGRIGEYLMPKLADFGIAHSDIKKRKAGQDTWDEDTETVSTVALFSPRWAAPEQLSGQPQGPLTDVYALGLLAAYMLAGRPLFEGVDVRSTFSERVKGDALVTRLLESYGVADALRPALLGALAADLSRRTKSPGALRDALRTAIAALPAVPAPRPTPRPLRPSGAPMITKRRNAESSLPPPMPPRKSAAPLPLAPKLSSTPPRNEAPSVAPRASAPPTMQARFVDVPETIDLSFRGEHGDEIRFRLTFVPLTGTTFRVMVKGLSSFVAAPGKPTSPAVTLQDDAVVRFVSPAQVDLGTLKVSFGTERMSPNMGPDGQVRVFQGPHGEMVVPFTHAFHAVALQIGGELLVACHR